MSDPMPAASGDNVPGGGSAGAADVPVAEAVAAGIARLNADDGTGPAALAAVVDRHISAPDATAKAARQPAGTPGNAGESGRPAAGAVPPGWPA